MVTTDEREAAELLEEAGSAMSHAGRPGDAESDLRDALARQEALGDRAATARVTAALAEALMSSGRAKEALQMLEPATVTFEDLSETTRGSMLLMGQLARAYMFAERWQAAIETADRVLRVAEQADAVDVVADVLVTRGSALCMRAQPYSGLGAIQAGHDLALTHSLEDTVLRALNNICAYGGLSEPRHALSAALSGLAIARRSGDRSMVAYLAGNAIEVASEVGDWDIARRETDLLLADDGFAEEDRAVFMSAVIPFLAVAGDDPERLLAMTKDIDPERIPDIEGVRAAVRVAAGDLEGARHGYLEAAHENELNAADSYLNLGRIAVLMADAEALREALAGFRAVGLRGRAVPGYIAELEAGLAALEGRPMDARAGYEEALRHYREMDLPFQVAQACTSMAFALGVEDPAVRVVANEGRAILVRLGATPLLRRLERVLGGPEGHESPSAAAEALAIPE